MRSDNIAMLEDTLDILDKGYYMIGERRVWLTLSREQMEAADVYFPEDIKSMSLEKDLQHVNQKRRCGYSCENADSFSLARKRLEEYSSDFNKEGTKPILVLNLANAVNPGGGVRHGAKAQEEDLCRKSSLLVSLEGRNAFPYYRYNRERHSDLGSDAIVINPQVEIIKDEHGTLLPKTAVVAVMTCAAPRFRTGRVEGMPQTAYEAMMYGRITGMLKTAASLGYRYLVLGAFGCGAFHNDARVVSDLFYKALNEYECDGVRVSDLFRRVDFAVMDHSPEQYNFREFSRNFADFYREEGRAANPSKIFFWKDNEENGYLSNWYLRKFVIDDFEYLHVEQYMMSQKAKLFHDSARYTAILRATKPWECKDLGKQVTPFDAKAWNAVKYNIVKEGNRAKFEQNPDLKLKLLSTGDAILAEASPKDKIWGIGLDAQTAMKTDMSEWPGQGLLGRALMELRAEFTGAAGKPGGLENRLKNAISIQKISITDLATDAVVNAANDGLWAGSGVCGAIFKAAGYKKLQAACDKIGHCDVGSAVITPGFDLKAKHIIHAVGPRWIDGEHHEPQRLYSAYATSLKLAKENRCHSIGFPLISAGIFGYPLTGAWNIALRACLDFVQENTGYDIEIVFAVLDDRILREGSKQLKVEQQKYSQ